MPDIVVIGKGLSGGLFPITATVIRRPMESVFHEDPFIHVSTFRGAELGCRIASRILKISSDSEFLDHVNLLADRFVKGIEDLRERHARFLIGLRHMGLMMGLELSDELSGPLVTKTAYDHDLLMIYANNDPSVCQLLPPLVMDLEQVDWVMEQLDKALPDIGPALDETFNPDTLWWHHEKLHRAILLDYESRCEIIKQERDALETSFINQAYGIIKDVRSSFTERAFRQSWETTSKWVEAVQGIPIRRQANPIYRRFWKKQNNKAGITHSPHFNPALRRAGLK